MDNMLALVVCCATPLTVPAHLPLSASPCPAVGQAVAQSFDFQLGAQWSWGSVGLCWGSLVLYSIAGALALRWTNPPAPQPTGA